MYYQEYRHAFVYGLSSNHMPPGHAFVPLELHDRSIPQDYEHPPSSGSAETRGVEEAEVGTRFGYEHSSTILLVNGTSLQHQNDLRPKESWREIEEKKEEKPILARENKEEHIWEQGCMEVSIEACYIRNHDTPVPFYSQASPSEPPDAVSNELPLSSSEKPFLIECSFRVNVDHNTEASVVDALTRKMEALQAVHSTHGMSSSKRQRSEGSKRPSTVPMILENKSYTKWAPPSQANHTTDSSSLKELEIAVVDSNWSFRHKQIITLNMGYLAIWNVVPHKDVEGNETGSSGSKRYFTTGHIH
ncbi:hypothetical protein VNO77_19951 [Canavalia gladiata]|uniref:Probable ubiquitin-like-specific protease 2A/B PH domain-containing protein n=1 Tax=Canavalia gladiata TaxID=3824 RepID=A0AAN9LTJ2_CANGL